jgi:hypothetical protein
MLNSWRAQGKTIGLLADRPTPLRSCYVIDLRPGARTLEMLKMIPQTNSNGRNRPRPNFSRNTQRPQGNQKSSSNDRSRWQQKYDHYCALAQATNGDDAVTREQHWQHAEHYLRMMNGSAT